MNSLATVAQGSSSNFLIDNLTFLFASSNETTTALIWSPTLYTSDNLSNLFQDTSEIWINPFKVLISTAKPKSKTSVTTQSTICPTSKPANSFSCSATLISFTE